MQTCQVTGNELKNWRLHKAKRSSPESRLLADSPCWQKSLFKSHVLRVPCSKGPVACPPLINTYLMALKSQRLGGGGMYMCEGIPKIACHNGTERFESLRSWAVFTVMPKRPGFFAGLLFYPGGIVWQAPNHECQLFDLTSACLDGCTN